MLQVGWNVVLCKIATSEPSKPKAEKGRAREAKDVELGDTALKQS